MRVSILISCLFFLFAVCAGYPATFDPSASWLLGSATVSITPRVNGTTDYVHPIDEFDPDSPGTLVLDFDDGQIAIGNGDSNCNWVRDHVYGSVIALRGSDNVTLVITGMDLYMIFSPDIELYYARLRRAVGQQAFDQLRFLTSATHNHHGPDTSGLSLRLNRDWFSSMLDSLVDATVSALGGMEPVTLTFSDSHWRFGQGDKRDPLVVDPTLNVMQAVSQTTGLVKATLVQWSFHPEITLGYSPRVSEADCLALGEGASCSANGRYISADYPGHLRKYLVQHYGAGDVVYVNGPLGAQIGAHGPVWEVSPEFPITGDGSVPPSGATIVPKDFRKALLVGRELANAVIATIRNSRARVLPLSAISYKTEPAFTRISHVGFRAGFAPKYLRPNQPLVIGYELRDLFVCKIGLPPNDDNCVSDNYETVEIAGLPLPLRVGEFARAAVHMVQIGPVTMFSIPGELAPEIANGLPTDFDLPESVPKYYKNPQWHPLGPDYVLPGVLKDMLKCEYCWTFGLTGDAAGYIFPIADWRLGCSGPDCDGVGYISGEACKRIFDSGDDEGKRACVLGQLQQFEDHYEETISASWDVASDIISAYSRLLSVPASGRYTKPSWTA